MKRTWLLFSQAVTILVAAYFVVATLQPDWLRRGAVRSNAGIALLEAPATPVGEVSPGSFAPAAKKAAPAVVSINTSKAVRHPRSNDPWFQFFFGDQGTQEQAGLGSGVIISPDGYILTNNHVVEGADDIEVTLTDSRQAKAQVIGTDPETDLAVLKIDLTELPVATLGNYRLAWVRGYKYQDYLPNVRRYNEIRRRVGILPMLLYSRADYYIDAQTEIDYVLSQAQDPSQFKRTHLAELPLYLGFASNPRGREMRELYDQRMAQLVSTGRLRPIFERWKQPYPFDGSPRPAVR